MAQTRTITHSFMALISVLTLPVHAAQVISLQQAVDMALANNPQVKQIQLEHQATQLDIEAAEADSLPVIQAGYLARRTNNALESFADKLNVRSVTAADFDPLILNNPDSSGLQMASIQTVMPVYTGGSLSASIDAARAISTAAGYTEQRVQQAVTYQVHCAYLSLQAAEKALSIATRAREIAEKHFKTNARLYKQNRVIESDYLTTQVNLAAYKTAESSAKTNVIKAGNALLAVIGIKEDSIQIEPWHDEHNPADVIPLETMIQHALDNRSDLIATDKYAFASKQKEQAERGATKPQVNVFASQDWYQHNSGSESDSWKVGIQLTMDIDYRGKTDSKVQAAASRALKMKYAVSEKRNEIIEEVRNAHRDLAEAEERLSIAVDNVENAEKAARLIKERYGQRRTILIDLLQAEKALVDARITALEAQLKLKAGKLAMRFVTGGEI